MTITFFLALILLISVLSVPLGADSRGLGTAERERDKLWSR